MTLTTFLYVLLVVFLILVVGGAVFLIGFALLVDLIKSFGKLP